MFFLHTYVLFVISWVDFTYYLRYIRRTSNVPGRPVISNNETATKNISAFLDFCLENIVSTIPHVLEATRDFLQTSK